MATSNLFRINSISQIHRLMGLPKPQHPLIGIIDLKNLKADPAINAVVFDLYVVSLKRGCDKLIYGQQPYDFDEGLMAFMSPGQILRGEENGVPSQLDGWMLFIHPDFLWHTALSRKMKQYDFFGYSAHEALFLSDKEETIINGIIDTIRGEYQANMDKFSQDVIVAHLEVLFTYAQRFYERQFITRKITNSKLLERVDDMLTAYFRGDDLLAKGLPTVQQIAQTLHVSTKYLSSLLKQLTGQTTQQLIHEKLIERAKERLSTTELSVSEIAYELGFEHPQSFSKLFKARTAQSPLAFRASFN
ncbi:helix-turn-helix domain-containing protein [Spirosoma rigui]|uniref:helix-turn-helix domain-containing protein n=1 Tax=Spirosoma rigui TaxID=564064 RepID=UPI0009AF6211|nr:response regulator transcription factor [Spirosoma rigui]